MTINQMSLAHQLRQALLGKISSGEWRPGMKLPAEADLSVEFGISIGTVRKALEFLEDNSFIVRQQGRGSFVMDPADQSIIERFDRFRAEDGTPVEQVIEILSYEEGAATEEERDILRLHISKNVRRFSRLRRVKGKPFLYETIALPCDLFPATKDIDNPELWIAISARNCGVLLGDVSHKLSLAPCPPNAALHLGRVVGETVMRVRGLTLTLRGAPARWRDAYCTSDNLYYSVLLPRSS